MTRTKSAVIVFVVLAVAVAAALSIDYTDTYVADRFHKALADGQYEADTPFSLGTFLEYYDWDTVCVIVPGEMQPELSNQFGLPYTPKADEGVWGLVFVKGNSVVAEIPIQQDVLGSPQAIPAICLERWAAIVEIVTSETGKQMVFVGH